MQSEKNSQFDLNNRSLGLILHQRLLANDPLASADIADAFFEPVRLALRAKYPTTDAALISDAVTDAYVNYIVHPTTFDPTKRSLYGYLKMSTEGDLKNALDKKKKESGRLVPLDSVVELSESSRNNPVEEDYLGTLAVEERVLAWQTKQVAEVSRVAGNDLDRQLLKLLMVGERHTEEYARLLDIEHLALSEQRRIVKQHKDRLRLRLKRRQNPNS